MNMVRAGAVAQPADWEACGCRELAEEGKRRRPIIDRDRLLDCLEFSGHWQAFAEWHRRTLGELVSSGWRVRESVWSTAAAVGTRPFLDWLAGGLGGAEVRRMPDPDTTAGSVALAEGAAIYALHLSERTRRLFWEDRQ